MTRYLALLASIAFAASVQAQTVENDLVGLGMPAEQANYLAGILPAGSVLGNNTYLKGRNQANSADISVLRVDSTDDTVLNADTGDTIKLSVAGTTVGTVSSTSLSLDQDLVFGTSTKGIRFAVGTLAAAGSVQGDAAAIADRVTTVTASDGTKGVILPASPTAGDLYRIINTVAAVLKIYPGSGDAINATAANTAVNIAASVPVDCIAVSASQWWCSEGTAP